MTTNAAKSVPPSELPGTGPAIELPDAQALLVALTLSPATYSRNRFYEMYTSPEMRRARRRAGQLRGIVAALVADETGKSSGRLLSIAPTAEGGAVLVYEVASVGMRRTVRLGQLELSLVRYCVGRRGGASAPSELYAQPIDSERITAALHRLSPLPEQPPSNETT